MNITITGKDVKATEAIKDYVEKKMDRVSKYFEGDVDVYVTIKSQKTEQIAEMSVKVKQDSYRAVTSHKDMYASIDKDIDILEGQIRKIKTKKDSKNMTESIRMKEEIRSADTGVENEVIKNLYYSIKPMGVEDAKLLLLGKPADRFLTFINIDTGKVNVIYRLKDNKNFGLISPEE
jgi:putative sigma-54 modulation protein